MVDSWQIFGIIVALGATGVVFNRAVVWLEVKGYMEGYTSLAVALGVLVTLAGVALLDWKAALLALVAFVASGTPMIVGSIARYVKKREMGQEQIRHGDDTIIEA